MLPSLSATVCHCRHGGVAKTKMIESLAKNDPARRDTTPCFHHHIYPSHRLPIRPFISHFAQVSGLGSRHLHRYLRLHIFKRKKKRSSELARWLLIFVWDKSGSWFGFVGVEKEGVSKVIGTGMRSVGPLFFFRIYSVHGRMRVVCVYKQFCWMLNCILNSISYLFYKFESCQQFRSVHGEEWQVQSRLSSEGCRESIHFFC